MSEGVTVATSGRLGFGKVPHGAMKTGLWASADYLGRRSHPSPSWPLGFCPGSPAHLWWWRGIAIRLGLVEGEGGTVATSGRLGVGKRSHGAMIMGLWASAGPEKPLGRLKRSRFGRDASIHRSQHFRALRICASAGHAAGPAGVWHRQFWVGNVTLASGPARPDLKSCSGA